MNRQLTFGSLFAGVGGFDQGFEKAGMRCLWQCEIDPNCGKLLRSCRAIYTDAERLELGKQLAEEHNELGQANSDFDGVKAEFKARITGHEAKIVDLANKVSTGHRMESVKCKWLLDQPAPGKKQLQRLDTNEIIDTEEMSEHDKQADLPLTPTEMELKLNEALFEGLRATVTGVAGDGTVTVAADKS